MSRMKWPGGGIEFHPCHGDWIRLLRESGFMVEASTSCTRGGAETLDYYDIATAQWARRCRLKTLWTRATNKLRTR
jgi:hypothetical protein